MLLVFDACRFVRQDLKDVRQALDRKMRTSRSHAEAASRELQALERTRTERERQFASLLQENNLVLRSD